MSELTCDVIFTKNVNYGSISTFNTEVGERLGDYLSEYIEVGRVTVTVEIKDDITPETIEALKAEKQKIGAEAQVKINNLEEQIQSLLAIECDS